MKKSVAGEFEVQTLAEYISCTTEMIAIFYI